MTAQNQTQDVQSPVNNQQQQQNVPAVKTSNYPYSMDYLFDLVISKNASDLHLTSGYPAMIRIDGVLVPVGSEVLTQENTSELVNSILNESKKELLDINREVDFAYSHQGKGRFRINAFYQQQTISAALRLIPDKIKSIDELKLPTTYYRLTKLGQGLVLVTGPTGHGKTTTLAAMLQEINQSRPVHIITIEDPIEYILPKGKAMVDQREMHDDTHSWEIALKSAMRQDPDVVLVGEMRDYETIAAAVTLAETGHLVFATLHTNNSAQTVDRIIDVFPEHQQAQIRAQLSNILEAVIAQRLIPLEGGGRRAASEIMLATNAVRNLIREGKTHQLDNVIMTGRDIGMISLEASLVKLVREGLITIEVAQEFAARPEEVVRLLKS
jgi:twitching motility protein PilT